MKPAPFVECSVCGREFGSKSIVIHERQCLQKLRRTEVDPSDTSNGETPQPTGRKKNGARSSKPSALVMNNFFITPFSAENNEGVGSLGGGSGRTNAVPMQVTESGSGGNRLPKLVSSQQVQRNNGGKDRPSTVTLSKPKILNLDFIQYDMSLTRIDNTKPNSTTVKIKTVTSQPTISSQVPYQQQQQQMQFNVTGASPIKFKSRSTGRINGTISTTMGMVEDSFGGFVERERDRERDSMRDHSKFPSVTSPPPPVTDNNRMVTSLRRQKLDRERVKLPDSNSLFSTFSTMLGDPDPNRPYDNPFKRSSLIQRSPTTTSTIADLHLHNPTMTMPSNYSNNAQYSYFTAAEYEDERERDDERMSFPKIAMPKPKSQTRNNSRPDRPHVRVRSTSRIKPRAARTTTVHCSLCTSYSYNTMTQDQDEPWAPWPSSSSQRQREQQQQKQRRRLSSDDEEERDGTNNPDNDNDDEVRESDGSNRIDSPTVPAKAEAEAERKGNDSTEESNQYRKFAGTDKGTITKFPPINVKFRIRHRQEGAPAAEVPGGQQKQAKKTSLEFIDQNQEGGFGRAAGRRAMSSRRQGQGAGTGTDEEMDDEFVVLKQPPKQMASRSSSACDLSMKIKERGKSRAGVSLRRVFRSRHAIPLPEITWKKMTHKKEDETEQVPAEDESGRPSQERQSRSRAKAVVIVSSETEELYETATSSGQGDGEEGDGDSHRSGTGTGTATDADTENRSDEESGESQSESDSDDDDDFSDGDGEPDEEVEERRRMFAKVRNKNRIPCKETQSAPRLLQPTLHAKPKIVASRWHRLRASATIQSKISRISTNVELLPGYVRPKTAETQTQTVAEAVVSAYKDQDDPSPRQRAEEPEEMKANQRQFEVESQNLSSESNGSGSALSMEANTDHTCSSQRTKDAFVSTDEYLDYYNILSVNLQQEEYPSSYSTELPHALTQAQANENANVDVGVDTEAQTLATLADSKILVSELTRLIQGQLKSQLAETCRKRSKSKSAAVAAPAPSALGSRILNPFSKVKEWLQNSPIALAGLPEVQRPLERRLLPSAGAGVAVPAEAAPTPTVAACGGDAQAVKLVDIAHRPTTAPPTTNGGASAAATTFAKDRSTLGTGTAGTSATGRFRDDPQPGPQQRPVSDLSDQAKKTKPKPKAVVEGDPNIIEGLMQAVIRIREERMRREGGEAEAPSAAKQQQPTPERVYKFTDRMTFRLPEPKIWPGPGTRSQRPQSATKAPTPKPKKVPVSACAKSLAATSAQVKLPIIPSLAARVQHEKTKTTTANPAKPSAALQRLMSSPHRLQQARPRPSSPYLPQIHYAPKKKPAPTSPTKGKGVIASGIAKPKRPLTPIVRPRPFDPNPSSPPPRPASTATGAATKKRVGVGVPPPKSAPAQEKAAASPKWPTAKKALVHCHSANKSCQFPEKRSAFTQSSPAQSVVEFDSELSTDGKAKTKQERKSILKAAARDVIKLKDVMSQISRAAALQTDAEPETTPAPARSSAGVSTGTGKSVQFKELHERLSPTSVSEHTATEKRSELDEDAENGEEIVCSPTKVRFHKSENDTHAIYQFHRQSPMQSPHSSSSLPLPVEEIDIDRSPIAYTLLMPKGISNPASPIRGKLGVGDSEAGIDLNVIVRRETADGQFPAVETVIPEYLEDWMYLVVDEPRIPARSSSSGGDANAVRSFEAAPGKELGQPQLPPPLPPTTPANSECEPRPEAASGANSIDRDVDLYLDLDVHLLTAIVRNDATVDQEVKKLLKIHMKRRYGENKLLDYC